tara:strand:- start:52 stop:411 length:360 start_codon:yes stop_codon:yes gene_type:complete
MEQNRKKASILYAKSMSGIKDTKTKFKKIVRFINNNQEINNQLTPEIKTHLKHLINLWNNNDDANIEYYFEMKEHHSYINGQIENENLERMWDDYLKSGLEFRTFLLKLNELCNNINDI